MKVKIKIQGREVELDPREARKIYDSLKELFDKDQPAIPTYIPYPVGVPYPTPQQPVNPWHEPYSPWTIICGDPDMGGGYSTGRIGDVQCVRN